MTYRTSISSIGNAAANYKRESTLSSLSAATIKELEAKYVAYRDPLLMHDPAADVEFGDFLSMVAASEYGQQKARDTLASKKISAADVKQKARLLVERTKTGLRTASKSLKNKCGYYSRS